MQGNIGLLEYLCQEVGCSYISDLCQVSSLPRIQEVVRQMETNKYDIEQWSDAVSYITKKKVQRESAGQYINYLLEL